MLEFKNIYKNKRLEDDVKKLYSSAFPADEKMPYFILKYKAKKHLAQFYAVYDGDLFVGLAYCVPYRDILFLFYLAVSDQVRGQGYGGRILNAVCRHYAGYRIVLNIEEVNENSSNYDQRVKRRSFYEKNGFFTLDYQIKEGKVVYDMMCRSESGNGVTMPEYYKMIKNYLKTPMYLIYRAVSR